MASILEQFAHRNLLPAQDQLRQTRLAGFGATSNNNRKPSTICFNMQVCEHETEIQSLRARPAKRREVTRTVEKPRLATPLPPGGRFEMVQAIATMISKDRQVKRRSSWNSFRGRTNGSSARMRLRLAHVVLAGMRPCSGAREDWVVREAFRFESVGRGEVGFSPARLDFCAKQPGFARRGDEIDRFVDLSEGAVEVAFL